MKTYKRYRYPAQITSHAVWLYHRFTLSFRDIEYILAARGVIVSYETIRQRYPKHSLRSWGKLWLNQQFISPSASFS